MKKRLLLFPILFVFSYSVFGQQLTPMVVSSSGGTYNNSDGMLSFTTGEMSVIETLSSSSFFLTQGFQQPWELSTSISSVPESDLLFGIQPNPSNGYFWMISKSESPGLIHWNIVNILGKKILQGEFEHNGNITTEPIDLTSAPSGTYFISMTIQSQATQPSALLVYKIQIIRSSSHTPTQNEKSILHSFCNAGPGSHLAVFFAYYSCSGTSWF